MSDVAAFDPPPAAPEPATPALPPPRGRSAAAIVWIIVLAVLLLAAAGGGVYLYLETQRLQAANEESERINEEQRQLIDEQNELLDEKETFGAAMEDFMAKARSLDGVPIASLVPLDDVEALARNAWELRRSPASVASLTDSVRTHAEALQALIDTAAAQRGSNASGSLGESIIDELGAGHVRVVFDDPAPICGGDPIGCVSSEDPTLIHLDPNDFHAEYFDQTLQTLVAYHEFAHVLQFTNPGPTETAAAAFGDDWEFMADCYALTLTDSWTLDRRVWVSDFSYWDVSVGYGQVCDAGQRDVIRSWLGEVGFHYRPVTQGAA
ncbi:MAG TPA: hypothetical protein VNQ52_08870 [Microbacteriaceae bacterium]|nr:hypothetical protein [Microbacteriaceae bacterium]